MNEKVVKFKDSKELIDATISLFQKEISSCAAVHMLWTCAISPPMMDTSFVLVTLTRLIVSEPKH